MATTSTPSPRFSALATTEGEEPGDFQILELQKGTSASSLFPVPGKVLPGKRLSLKGKEGQLQLLLLKN